MPRRVSVRGTICDRRGSQWVHQWVGAPGVMLFRLQRSLQLTQHTSTHVKRHRTVSQYKDPHYIEPHRDLVAGRMQEHAVKPRLLLAVAVLLQTHQTVMARHMRLSS